MKEQAQTSGASPEVLFSVKPGQITVSPLIEEVIQNAFEEGSTDRDPSLPQPAFNRAPDGGLVLPFDAAVDALYGLSTYRRIVAGAERQRIQAYHRLLMAALLAAQPDGDGMHEMQD